MRWPFRDGAIPEVVSAEKLRRNGDTARDQRNWAAAAQAYRQYLELEPADGPIWVQHGNMLKEAGLLGPAAVSYGRAMELMPMDGDVRVQRAILHKFFGEFTEAVRLFEQARDLGFGEPGFIQGELEFLARTDNCKTFNMVLHGRSAPPFRIFLSSAAGPLKAETNEDLDTFLGSTNYSYNFSLKGFLVGLDALGLPYDLVESPEYVPDIAKQSFSTVNLHFAFQPPDQMRLLKGAYNIVVMAWEFERLRRSYELSTNHAFADPVAMLRRAQEVWLVSTFGAEAVRRSGVDSVHTTPTPILSDVLATPRSGLPALERMFRAAGRLERVQWISLALVPGFQATASQDAARQRNSVRTLIVDNMGERDPVFFLTVLNVHDYRKQLKPVLDAFVRLAKVRPKVFLPLKVSFVHHAIGDLNEFMLRYQINDPSEIAPPLVSDRIWMTADVLSRAEMNDLYDISAFYVSTAHGEGQNLPLLEAMGRGAVPVSVDHTAMRDYISPENAIVVRSTLEPFGLRLRERYGMNDLNTYYVSARDAYRALANAADTDDVKYAALSHNALAQVRDQFGLLPFRAAIERAIERATLHSRKRGA